MRKMFEVAISLHGLWLFIHVRHGGEKESIAPLMMLRRGLAYSFLIFPARTKVPDSISLPSWLKGAHLMARRLPRATMTFRGCCRHLL